MDKKAKTLIYNIGIFAIGNVLVKLISLFLMPLYTSYMTAEQYGIAELLNNLIEIILPLGTLCIIDAVYRYSIDDDTDLNALFTNAVKTLIKGYLAIFIICLLIRQYEYIWHFYALYVSTTIHKLCSQFARGLGHVKRFAFSGILNAFCLFIFNIIFLVFLNGGIEEYLVSLTLSHLIAGMFNFITSKEYQYFRLRYGNKHLQKELLRFSIPNIPNGLSWWLNNISGRYIILYFLGSSVAGLYTAASKLPAIINMLAMIFQQAWQFSTSKEIDKKDSKIFFTKVFSVYHLFIVFCTSFIILFIPYFSKLILKGEFYLAWRYVPFLLVGASLGCLSSFFGTFYTAKKNNQKAMITTLIGASVNVILNFVLVRMIGIMGALIANVFSFGVITVLRCIDTNKYSGICYKWGLVIIQYLILVIQAVICYLNLNYSFLLQLLLIVFLILLNLKNISIVLKNIQRKLQIEKKKGEKL